MDCDLLISGCSIISMSSKGLIEDGAIGVKAGRIVFVGKSSEASRTHAETRINARGKVALPGLVNAHTHVPMTLFRGVAEDQPLDVWLKETIWPLEARLKKSDVYAGALLGCLEMIKGGVTCFGDVYFREEMVAKAVADSGLRGVLAEGIIDSGNELLGRVMLRRSVDFVKKFNNYADGRVTAFLGPHAAYSCSRGLLQKVSEKASELGVGIHMHLAESKALFSEFEKKYGASEVEFLDKIGLLNRHVLAAHCIDLSENDVKILSQRGANVAHAPVANLKLGLGAAKIKKLIDLGVNVCLGTDGPASNNTLDMFETMKVAALLQKYLYRNPEVLPAYEVLKMATINGAKALRLEQSVGSLEVGKRADVILLDFRKPHLKPLHDVYAAVVYSARCSDVDTVVADGKVLMENRRVKTLDETAVIGKADNAAFDLVG